MISRNEASALIPEEVSRQIAESVAERSIFMQLATRLPNMTRAQLSMPVLSTLPEAYFVNPSDTGLQQTTNAAWSKVFVNAEELAVIVPLPRAVLSDADYDLWGQTRPALIQAIMQKVDRAVFYGTDRPASWPEGIVTKAVAAGNDVDLSTITAANGDLYDAILGENGVWSKVEEDGYGVTAAVSLLSMKGKLRQLRDENKQPILMRSLQGAASYDLDGVPHFFQKNLRAADASALMIAGEWENAVYSIREDMEFRVLTEATIQRPDGSILYNLAQQNLAGLQVILRMGWAEPNPANLVNPDASTRYHFGVLVA